MPDHTQFYKDIKKQSHRTPFLEYKKKPDITDARAGKTGGENS